MRKVLSIVLVLSLVLGSFTMVFADFKDMAGESSAEAVDVLSGLGVISGYPDGTFRPDNIVTRAEMAKLIVAALGLEKFAVSTTSKYPDMVEAPWAQGFVAYGTSLGFISGYPDGTFRPNRTVSYEEACSMILRALGYTSEFLPGDWPTEWVVKAKSLGILDGITAATSTGANRGDIAEMLYNALDLPIGYVDFDNVWRENDEGFDTMLARLGVELVEADDAANDGVIVGSEKSAINLRPFVGVYADRYVDKNDKIIKVVPVSVSLEGDWKTGHKFTVGDKDYKFKASAQAQDDIYLFVNGDLVDDEGEYSDIKDAGVTQVLAVKLDGNYITKIYSGMIWDVNDAFMVDKDILEELDEDETLNGAEFKTTSKDEIDFNSFELLGIDELGDLEEDNVVYLYLGDGGVIRRIAVGTEVVEGKVTKITAGEKVTVGGKVYVESDDYDDSDILWADIDVNDEVIFYLDYFGDVYKAEAAEKTVENYGIVLLTEAATSGSITGKDALAELFLADGTTKVFDVKSDVVGAAPWNVGNNWKDGDYFSSWAVKYSVNDKGVIKKMEDVAEVSGYKFVPAETLVTEKGYFNGVAISSSVLIFAYDGTGDFDDADSYSVLDLATIKGNKYTDVEYVVESNKIVFMYIWGAGSSDDDIYGVFTEVYKTNASATGYMAEVLVDGKAVSYEMTEDAYNTFVQNDDLRLFNFNGKGQLTSAPDVGAPEFLDEDGFEGLSSGVIKLDNGHTYALDSDAVAYKWNDDDDVYEAVKPTKNNMKDCYLKLYDLDEDLVVDVVLIFPAI